MSTRTGAARPCPEPGCPRIRACSPRTCRRPGAGAARARPGRLVSARRPCARPAPLQCHEAADTSRRTGETSRKETSEQTLSGCRDPPPQQVGLRVSISALKRCSGSGMLQTAPLPPSSRLAPPGAAPRLHRQAQATPSIPPLCTLGRAKTAESRAWRAQATPRCVQTSPASGPSTGVAATAPGM